MPISKGYASDGSAIFELRLPARGVGECGCSANELAHLNRQYGTDFVDLSSEQWGVLMDVHDFARAIAERDWPKAYGMKSKGVARAIAASILSDFTLAVAVAKSMRRRFAGGADHLSGRTVRRMPEYHTAAGAVASARAALDNMGLV